MSNVVRWDPLADLRVTMDRLFDDSLARPRRRIVSAREFASMVPVEVSETKDAFEVKAALPGVKPEEVDITVHDDVLTIQAEHKEVREDASPKTEGETAEGETKEEQPQRHFYRREIRYGSFERSLQLPTGVDTDRAEARFENGVLTLSLPKAEVNRPKQIKVTGTGSAS